MACDLPFGYREFIKGNAGEESYDLIGGQSSAIRVFDGPWESRHDFLASAVFPTVSDDESRTIVYGPLGKYPDLPSLIATKAVITGLGEAGEAGTDSQISFETARITVEYTTVSFDTEGGSSPNEDTPVFLSEEFDTSIEEITFPKITALVSEQERVENPDYNPGDGIENAFIMREKPDSERLKELFAGIKINIPIINFKITQHFLNKPRWVVISACMQSRLNDRKFITPSGLRAQRDTMLYMGPSGVIEYTIEGTKGWSITHNFAYKATGWNRVHCLIYNPAEEVTNDAGETFILDAYYTAELRSVALAKDLDGNDLTDPSLHDRRNLNALIYSIPFYDLDCGYHDKSDSYYVEKGGYNDVCDDPGSPYRLA